MILTYRKPGAKEGKRLTDLQMLASKENFAIFTLKGMRGQLTALRRCDSINRLDIKRLDEWLQDLIFEIKLEQRVRMQERKRSKK